MTEEKKNGEGGPELTPEMLRVIRTLAEHPERLAGLELLADRASMLNDIAQRRLMARMNQAKAEGGVTRGNGDELAAKLSGRRKSVLSAQRAHQNSLRAGFGAGHPEFERTKADIEQTRAGLEAFLDEHPDLRTEQAP